MTLADLQLFLQQTHRYRGKIDGLKGPMTDAAIMLALTDGPDTVLGEDAFTKAAADLQCPVPAIKAISKVEAAGGGFLQGRPVVLFEPHRFSRATGHRFDASHPDISYPRWDKSKYPPTQDGRYKQLLAAVELDVDAGFASASYGRFQILGENYRACGFTRPVDFAVSQAYDEESQLDSFKNFIRSNPRLLAALRIENWPVVAECYNGTAYALNHYDTRLASAATGFRLA